MKLKTLERAADATKGKLAYETQCVACHGKAGQGLPLPEGGGCQFPPLWGEHSYNQVAGLYRLPTFAQFAYAKLPLGATHDKPLLTEEEAWDIAAYVNSLPPPGKDLSKDWPDIRRKPFDHPFGPYAEPFEEKEHNLGHLNLSRNFTLINRATRPRLANNRPNERPLLPGCYIAKNLKAYYNETSSIWTYLSRAGIICNSGFFTGRKKE